MEKQKRERSSNFSQQETDLLLSLAESRIHIIENKKSDSVTWQEKEEAWKDIETAFNSLSGPVCRTHKHLKMKYEGLKSAIRKKVSLIPEDYFDGGGSSKVPQLTPTEQKVTEMIFHTVEGIERRDYTILLDASKNYQTPPLNESKEYVMTTLNESKDFIITPLKPCKEYVNTSLNESRFDSDVVMPSTEKRPIELVTEDKNETVKQKRERSVNFTQEETDLLVLLVEPRIQVVENKKSDSATWQKKEETWKDIETAFNSLSGPVYRARKHLKMKYEGLKREMKKKVASIRDDNFNGGGPSVPPQLTPTEQKVMKMIVSVEGNENIDGILLDASNDYVTTSLHESDDDVSNPLNETKVYVSTSFNGDPDVILPRRPKEKRSIDLLTEEKIEVVKIQKRIAEEDLEQKFLQRKILEKDLEHKDLIYELEKQHLLLKIELSKKALRKSEENDNLSTISTE